MPKRCYVRIHRDQILNRWEALSRKAFPAATDKSRASVRDHLPQLTEALCDAIETGVFEKPKELGKIHGRQRFSFGDYSLSQVLDEYWLLKEVIFDHLEQENEAVLADFRLINRFFESAATIAAAEFAKLRENELSKAARHLEASYEDLERFAAVAAHDLRSPVSTMIGFAELVLEDRGYNSEETHDQISSIKNIGLRMINLIDQLFEYAKIGKSNLEKKRFSLADSAHEAASHLAQKIADANAEIEIGILPELMGYPILFTQLFQNLFSNSLKFKSDKRPIQISVTGREDADLITIYIKDNGVGFDPMLNREIFEPFKRGNNAKNIQGSGLGLATVEKIVSLHAGKISAIGRAGEGAEFIIEIQRNE